MTLSTPFRARHIEIKKTLAHLRRTRVLIITNYLCYLLTLLTVVPSVYFTMYI